MLLSSQPMLILMTPLCHTRYTKMFYCFICVWAAGDAHMKRFSLFSQVPLHPPYISFYEACFLIHHPLMTSYSTGLMRGALYPATTLTSPIFISVFANKTVVLHSINNLSTLIFPQQPFQYMAKHGSNPARRSFYEERLIDSLFRYPII